MENLVLMEILDKQICDFLEYGGILFREDNISGIPVITALSRNTSSPVPVIPLEISSSTIEEAETRCREVKEVTAYTERLSGIRPLIITGDRWRNRPDMMKNRLLAHLEIFGKIYARNCTVMKIGKNEAACFLEENHSYGDAACRYRYGLFHKGKLVGAGEFSNARLWNKNGTSVRSYEWIRYASSSDTRICGGMGKILKQFIKDVHPDDIMSYADLEWSDGKAYEKLGFVREQVKESLLFAINPQTWERRRLDGGNHSELNDGILYFQNFGSLKYRLKLTDYH